jgi:RHS repeat-associated protein
MGCISIDILNQQYQSCGLQIVSSKKVLRSDKSEKNARSSYLFGFNSMERDDEVKGAGNSLDFGARIYDSRLGRWLSVDPLSAAYASIAPFVFVANTPIIAIDSDGRKISFGWMTSQASIEKFKSVLSFEFSGKVEVRIIEGMLTLHKVEGMELSESERVLYENLNIVINHDATVEIEIVQGDKGVLMGSFSSAYDEKRGGTYYMNILDILDIEKAKSPNSTPGALILHEIWESYLSQALGVKEGSIEETYLKVHPAAMKVEGSVFGINIVDGMSFVRDGNGAAYSNFLDKDGNQMHFEIIFEGGNVTGFSEKSGHVNLEQKQKEYEEY